MKNKIPHQRETFQSPYSEYEQHIGKNFEIIDQTEAAVKDHPDFKNTYLIRFEDGVEITALPVEVFDNTGWNP